MYKGHGKIQIHQILPKNPPHFLLDTMKDIDVIWNKAILNKQQSAWVACISPAFGIDGFGFLLLFPLALDSVWCLSIN